MAGGRPPMLKECARCHVSKPRRGYVSAHAEVCMDCRRAIRDAGGPSGVQAADLALADAGPPRLLMDSKVKDPILDAIRLDAMSASLAKLFTPLPRCECCYENRHVARDTYGGVVVVCARCDYQVRATGQCHLHHSRVFYPELLQPAAVASPPEVEALFYVRESEHRKYTEAELAEAE